MAAPKSIQIRVVVHPYACFTANVEVYDNLPAPVTVRVSIGMHCVCRLYIFGAAIPTSFFNHLQLFLYLHINCTHAQYTTSNIWECNTPL